MYYCMLHPLSSKILASMNHVPMLKINFVIAVNFYFVRYLLTELHHLDRCKALLLPDGMYTFIDGL